MAKRQSEIILHKLSVFIQQLTDEQYTKLLDGEATIIYEEIKGKNDRNEKYELLRTKIKGANSFVDTLNILKETIQSKKQLSELCSYLHIPHKPNDTKPILIEKVALNFGFKQDNSNDMAHDINAISYELQEFINIEEAKNYITNHKLLQLKKNLLLLAKIMDVHVTSKANKKDIINRIVESVVGSKIRSMAVRGEN